MHRIHYFLPFVLLGVLAGCAASDGASIMADQEAAVRATIDLYIGGAASGQAAPFLEAFDPHADIKSLRTNSETGLQEIRVTPIEAAIQGWTSRPPEESWGRILDVRIVDDQLAHVSLELLWRGTVYVDVMALYKANDAWKIVGKTYVSRGPVRDGGS